VAVFYFFNPPVNEQAVIGKDRVIGEFIVRIHPHQNSLFCGNDEILFASSSRHVVTVGLCEDNMEEISQQGDWVYGTTTTGRTFRANFITGKREILKAQGTHGFGGGISL